MLFIEFLTLKASHTSRYRATGNSFCKAVCRKSEQQRKAQRHHPFDKILLYTSERLAAATMMQMCFFSQHGYKLFIFLPKLNKREQSIFYGALHITSETFLLEKYKQEKLNKLIRHQ